MKRYEAIDIICRYLEGDELVVSSTGMISREFFAIGDSPRNFYMMGSMGLASSIGFGLALCLPKRRVFVLDGDGSILMNMGSLATIGHFGPSNLTHVVLDNEVHDSTGGQATASTTIALDKVAEAAGYRRVFRVTEADGLREVIGQADNSGPVFILVKVEKGGMPGVGRVSASPEEIRNRFRLAAMEA